MYLNLHFNHKTGAIEGRSLRGDKKTKVFANIKLKKLMPNN
jgi:hypothetical protein